jgi:flavin-dependent dehydrogenase
MYDVIVVGARCAGSPTAMLLARKGYKVLLVDRATFPSDIPHGHFIHREGPRRLAQWGLLDRIVSTNCPPVVMSTLDFGDSPLVAKDLVVDSVAMGYAPRRSILDKVLVDAAVEAGVEVREGFAVESFTADGDRLTGVRGRARDGGSLVTEHATVTVGADGRHSLLARVVQAPASYDLPAATCWYFSYWSGIDMPGLEIYVKNRSAIFAFPTHDQLTGIFIGWSAEALPEVRANIESEHMKVVEGIPSLAERVRNARREERFAGATDLPNFVRKPYGPGWALVGDAGCHKDPFQALGMCDAFRDLDLLVNALDAGLSGRADLQEALGAYERQRNDATLQDFWQNLNAAQFKPLPQEMIRLRAAVRGNQEATNRLVMATEGMIPRETFFNPENLGRLMASGPTAVAT